MGFYFKDYDGNEVLTPTFTQYDAGQVIYVTDVAYDPSVYTGGAAFHFWNRNSENVLFSGAQKVDANVADGDPSAVYSCALPNSLMAEGLPFFAAFFLANETTHDPACTVGIIRITMEQRPEPGFGLNYENETQITAQTIFSLIGVFGEGDAEATRDMIRSQTDGQASTYIGWLNKIVADAEANMTSMRNAASAELSGIKANAVSDMNSIKSDTNGYKAAALQAQRDAEAAERNAHESAAAAAQTLNATAQAAKDAITTDVLDGYHIAVSNTAPRATTSGQKVITFVIEA